MKRLFKVKTAEFSEDGKYRYVLTRIWDDTRPFAMCIGLNPSRADAEKDDTTISLLVNCLDALGFGGLKMVNVFAYITPHPKELNLGDPFDEMTNEHWIVTTAYSCQSVIFCWGNFKQVRLRDSRALKERFPDALCFGINANGSPWHPRAMTYAGITASQARLEKWGEVIIKKLLKMSNIKEDNVAIKDNATVKIDGRGLSTAALVMLGSERSKRKE